MLIPTIETDSVADVQQKIDAYVKVDNPNKPTHFQIDVVDGLFADMYTVTPSDLDSVDWHGLTHEYHLLVNEPDEYLEEVVRSGATKVIAQIERMHRRQEFILTAQEHNLIVGFALDLHTPISDLTDQELHQLDQILLMAVPAGFAGQTLQPQVIDKVKQLKRRGFSKPICIDGGVNSKNLSSLKAAGATQFAVNSDLWHDNLISENLKTLLASDNQ